MQNKFMDWFGLTAPILQAPIGGAASVALATAVGKAGGLGSLALTWPKPEDSLADATKIKASGVPFFVNFVLGFPNLALPLILDLGVPAITLSWGIDSALTKRIQNAGAKVGVQVGSALGAKYAIASGADFIIAQGNEAGGHVQSTTPLHQVLTETLAIAGTTPVIAAGGISSGAQIATTLKLGAAAVMLGTRFVAAEESAAHPLYKQAIINATAKDTAFTNCFDIDWPFAMHRVLRNSTFENWEAAGSPISPNRPGEGEIVANDGARNLIRYCDESPSSETQGDVLATVLYAGTSVDHITAVEPAGDIVKRLWSEAQANF